MPRIARIAASREPGSAGEIFAFLGAKGGVGTTTAAVNVATELARLRSGSVLLIDLHLAYGDAAVYLGPNPSSQSPTRWKTRTASMRRF